MQLSLKKITSSVTLNTILPPFSIMKTLSNLSYKEKNKAIKVSKTKRETLKKRIEEPLLKQSPPII